MSDPSQELETAREAFEAGNLAGLYTALVVCEQHGLPLPAWVHKALAELWNAYIRGSQDGKRWFNQWSKDQERYEAWDAVEDARRAHDEVREGRASVRSLEKTPLVEALEGELERWEKALSFTGEDAVGVYAEAQRVLIEGGAPDRSPRTVRRGHAEVQKTLRECGKAEQLRRYYGGRLADLRWRLLGRK